MNSRLIEALTALLSIGPRVRGALSERVLDVVWRRLVATGERRRMPLAPDPGQPSYWTRRADTLQVPGRYEKQY